ncbi:MAG TPA: Ig-like domain-containing protein [Gemmatimonadales bacterium]|jgi:uncharacterized protein YjdB
MHDAIVAKRALTSACAMLGAAAVSGALLACLTRGPTEAVSLIVTPATVSVSVGDTVTLNAAPADSGGAPAAAVALTVTWSSSDTAVATVTPGGLVTGIAPGVAIITATSNGGSGAAAITVARRPPPGTVEDLAVDATTDTSVTLRFTEVGDGGARPATYDVRYAPSPISWGRATIVSRGTCATPLAGTTVGAARRCTVLGLASDSEYDFQLVAFRGVLNRDAVFGDLSNIATGATAASTAPVASVAVTPESLTVVVGGTRQLVATLKDAKGNVLRGRQVTWTSSAPTVASVTATGLVTAVALGSATIGVTSEGHSGSSSITVVASPPPVTYYRTNFNDGTPGPLTVYAYGGGSCVKSTTYTDSGSPYAMACTIPAGTGAAALEAWFGEGQLATLPKDPTLDQDLFEEVRFVLAPGAAAAIGGTSCTPQNRNSQFKVHKSVYGEVGSNTNGWIAAAIVPCGDGNIGLFAEAERWNLVKGDSVFPNTYPSLREGSVYDVVYRYHRYTAQGCGTVAVWVNGTKIYDSACWPDMGATYGSTQGLVFWDGATYLQSGLGPLTVYTLFAQATNYPIGPAFSSPQSDAAGALRAR